MKARVLVVDDSQLVRAVLRDQLQGLGHDVVEASSGESALGMAGRADVILLDVEMPGMDGFTVLERLQQDAAASSIPVIFLTGRTDSASAAAALDAGAHDYLRKPFEPVELLARVRSALRVSTLTRELQQRGDDLERLSRVDALTGVGNRRHLDERLLQTLHRGLRRASPTTVALLDVDRFKSVNDTLGHQAGDDVLVEVARRLQDAERTEDEVGRWGGEEFLIVLPDTDDAGARIVGERLRTAVSDSPVVLLDGAQVSVTASVGMAVTSDVDPRVVLRRCDDALYRAKGAGRDRVEVAPPLEPYPTSA